MLPLSFAYDPAWYVPDEAACLALWDKYAMLPNVRDHSRTVAETALYVAGKAVAAGYPVRRDLVLAAGLLHDIAKSYAIRFGGSHDQLGAAWLVEETGNPALAQTVLFHVRWPWEDGALAPERDPLRPPLLLSWADKRVRHDHVVSLGDRYADLMRRYGTNARSRQSITRNNQQAQALERDLERLLGPLAPPEPAFVRLSGEEL